MLDLVTTTQFRKDLRKLRKRGADMQKLDDALRGKTTARKVSGSCSGW